MYEAERLAMRNLIDSQLNAIKTGHSVPLFNKLAVNRWQLVGFFTIVDANYVHDERRSRMIWRFTLQRSQELEGHS